MTQAPPHGLRGGFAGEPVGTALDELHRDLAGPVSPEPLD